MAEEQTVRILEYRNSQRLENYLSKIFSGWPNNISKELGAFFLLGAPLYVIVCAIFSFKFIWLIPLAVLCCALFFPFVHRFILIIARLFFPRWSKKVYERYEIIEKNVRSAKVQEENGRNTHGKSWILIRMIAGIRARTVAIMEKLK